MVDLFFVLSGFVISYNYDQRVRSTADAKSFMKKRFWRVWPLHMIMIFVFIGIECLKFGFEITQGVQLDPPAFSQNYIASFFANVFLIHSLGPFNGFADFNAVSWSISVEFYTYLIFAIICLTGRLRVGFFLVVILISVFILFFFHGRLTSGGKVFGIYRSLYSFGVGFFAYQAFLILSTYQKKLNRYLLYVVAMALLGAIAFWAFGKVGRTPGEIIIPAVYGITVLALALAERENDFLALFFKPLLWLGAVSCSIYMVHLAINWFFVQVLRVILEWPTVIVYSNREKFEGSLLYGNMALLLYLLVIFWISSLSFKYIEDRFRRGLKAPSGNHGAEEKNNI